jgi:hypothetical protein
MAARGAGSKITEASAWESQPLAPPADAAQRPARSITARAILLAIPLVALNAYWITVVEVRWYTLDGTSLPLFITPIFFLFCICALNALWRRVAPARALDTGELLTIYIMLVVGTVFAAHDLLQNLFGILTHADYFATPESGYKDTFFKYLVPSRFLLVSDATALKGWYQGGVAWFRPQYLLPFLGPLCWWALFVGVLFGMCLCINVLIRKAWTEDEKLAFPIIQLPMAMVNPDDPARPFWKSRLMWSGFTLAALLDLLNGMHYLVPSLPYIAQVKLFDIGQFVTVRPWSAIGPTNISMYPFAIGLAYFLPLDLAFSCWFFFVARKLFQVTGAVAGWDASSNVGFPYFEQQASGAWIMLSLLLVWSLRKHLRRAWIIALLGGADSGKERREFRVAFAGLAGGVAFLALFSNRIGLNWWVALLFFGLFFLLALAITRVRAELGAPHEIYFVSPRTVLVTVFGVNAIGAQSLTALSVLYWFNRGYRAHPMPNQLEAFRMGEGAGVPRMQVAKLLLIAAVIGLIFAYWANLQVTYTDGALARSIGYKKWVGAESFDKLKSWLTTPTKPNWNQLAFVVGGAILVLALRGMRGAYLAWPFHPVGYALAVSFAMDYFWFAFFISWLAKSLIVRFGGMKAHNSAIPFFLGLILGDYVMGSLWAIYGPASGLQTYKIYI